MAGINSSGIRSPIAAGILFGLGLGGFFDGIVLHQVLQHDLGRHFSQHYLFVVAGLFALWRMAHRGFTCIGPAGY